MGLTIVEGRVRVDHVLLKTWRKSAKQSQRRRRDNDTKSDREPHPEWRHEDPDRLVIDQEYPHPLHNRSRLRPHRISEVRMELQHLVRTRPFLRDEVARFRGRRREKRGAAIEEGAQRGRQGVREVSDQFLARDFERRVEVLPVFRDLVRPHP